MEGGVIMPEHMIWFIAGVVLIVLEIFVPGFVIVWFGFGAIVAGFAAFFGAGHLVQILLFLGVSLVSVFLAQMFIKKKEKQGFRVGAERLIGKRAKVIRSIVPPDMGMVKVEGEEWRATADEEIKIGEMVIIDAIEGTHLVVHRENNE